ncbi:hypothetical protein [cf. Phormidesmis sp. LEGE 11477]|uniref:hypothetical protein n=1 Tax=cf. Phormidesmis sp. LEGE 11477 TaxID=1828680 RepID=UPI0018805DBD|nr:hypothetical protein [cf. Phormidesmis sp. LEGE 11477]MBE9063986.1 hypothetical protein [cf. Phormidesmis sp. LEGE 11477]
MSIEQTNQLILLILNSALMMLLSAGLLGGAWLRQNTLLQQMHRVKSRYQRLTHSPNKLDITSDLTKLDPAKADSLKADIKADLKRVREYRLQLNHQYQWSHIGMLMLHAALIVFGISLLCLSLRSLFNVNSLIVASLILFTLGSIGLIAGSGCILVDLSKGNSQNDSLGRLLGQLIRQIVWLYQKLNQKKKSKATPHSEPG